MVMEIDEEGKAHYEPKISLMYEKIRKFDADTIQTA